MMLDSLLIKLEGRGVTPVTLDDNITVTVETRQIGNCTSVTSVTPENNEERIYLFNERAAIYEFDAGYSREKADRLARGDVLTKS
jgi:hypothetical protein